ncbi:DNA-binding LacI/PurR family transcriptional regulator [Pullulanibacillus pueri]|uniref:LacI family transcriptional regulator n=1 Tax=Pullulanibacillus pueri TaxID=1437324 RepID=A0A8J3ENG6_9BACL|nr:LacI family DNA-binding transcriptional regulator [Pullulanibacillus pueri]MBM7682901.1 DNA-binding LacI/PurR family transcriptional regulator [Pullulanibacillus pueri]GGH84433.1 LacI family transcriptional regulator [Pullulanibacillus pueri]
MTTIEDVAKLTGYSRATVSRVINNYPYVSEEKRRKVLQAMEQLGYVPNSIARQLRTRINETIGVLIPRLSNPFFSKLVDSMESIAAENGFQVIVCQTRSEKSRELLYLNWLKTRQMGGVIMASSENDWDVIKEYRAFGPIIFCNEYPPHTEAPIICLDQHKGGYIGTKHLIERGHTKIAHCYAGSQFTNIRERFTGQKQALEECGLELREEWIFKDAYDTQDGRRIYYEMMALENRPDGVFTSSDEVALGILAEARKNHTKVPEELAVLGFDDQPIAELVYPSISTVHQPVEKMGKAAIELMISLLKGEREPRQQVIELPLHLVIREST